MLPSQWHVVGKHNENDEDLNHADAVLWQTGEPEPREVARLILFVTIIKQQCFEELRTRQQLGYIVSCSSYVKTGASGLLVLVQSNTKAASFLEERIQEFIMSQVARLRDMRSEEFSKFMQSAQQALQYTEKSVDDRATRWLAEIDDFTFMWDRRERVAAALESIRHPELVQWVKSYFEAGPSLSSWVVPKNAQLPAKGSDSLKQLVRVPVEGTFVGSPVEMRSKITQYRQQPAT